MRSRTRSTRISPPPPGIEPSPASLNCEITSRSGIPKRLGEMLKLRRAESVDVDVRIFFADVPEQIEIPIESKLRMMPALHQNLHAADGGQFVQFLVQLLASSGRNDPHPFRCDRTRRTCSKRCRRSCS